MLFRLRLKEATKSWYRCCWRKEQMLIRIVVIYMVAYITIFKVATMAMLSMLLPKEAMRSWYRCCWIWERMSMLKVADIAILFMLLLKEVMRSW